MQRVLFGVLFKRDVTQFATPVSKALQVWRLVGVAIWWWLLLVDCTCSLNVLAHDRLSFVGGGNVVGIREQQFYLPLCELMEGTDGTTCEAELRLGLGGNLVCLEYLLHQSGEWCQWDPLLSISTIVCVLWDEVITQDTLGWGVQYSEYNGSGDRTYYWGWLV